MYEKDLICLFTAHEDLFTHFERAESIIKYWGYRKNPHGKPLTKQNLTGVLCA